MYNSFGLVSVIVPNYNHAPFLKRRLDSIFNQTYHNFEVIILDDCSTDNSSEIIESYQSHPQVSHILYNKKNSGSPFIQWAKGFSLARGKYIWIAESDDWAEPNFLSILIPNLEKSSTAVAFSNSILVYPDKQENALDIQKNILFKGMYFLKKHMVYGNSIVNASSAVFKKDFLKKIPSTYQTFKSSGDWLFWIEQCLLGDVYFHARPLNYNNRHGSNVTAEWSDAKRNGTSILEDFAIYSYLRKKNILSFYQKYSIIAIKVRWIESKKEKFVSRETYNHLKNVWGHNSFAIVYSKCVERCGYYLWKLLKLFHSEIG